MTKKNRREKPYLGRIPIPPPGGSHRDRSKYSRKRKHKGRADE